MNHINLLLTFSSLTVILVSIERFSFTTKILLPPFDFLRLHELVQMLFLIPFTVIIPFLLLRLVSREFEALKGKRGLLRAVLFILGVYLYATGNGVHELGSFVFNTYCDTKTIVGSLCGGLFFNDYYFGNILYFSGAFLMNGVIVWCEMLTPNKSFGRKNLPLLLLNSIIYSLAIFAYAGFDRVLVGLVYSLISTLVIDGVLFSKKNLLSYPVTLSLAISYTLGTVLAILIRLF